MAKDIADGYLLVTDRVYARLLAGELEKLGFELDRALRDLRGEQPALEDMAAIQLRNRKLSRLTSALTMLRAYQQRRFRTGRPQFDGNT